MTREQFINGLRGGLVGLAPGTVAEIVSDYEGHFNEGLAAGRSETEVAEALGDPARHAREIRAEAGLKRWETDRNASSAAGAVFAVLGLGALDLIIVIPFLTSIGGVLFAFFMAAVACLGVGAMAMVAGPFWIVGAPWPAMVLTGLGAPAKAALATDMLFDLLGGRDQFESVDVRLVHHERADADDNEEATAELRVTVKDPDPGRVGRRFSGAVTELALASYAGFFTLAPPGNESAYGIYWPALVDAGAVSHRVTLPDGSTTVVTPTPGGADDRVPAPAPAPPETPAAGPTTRVPLGAVCGARSGDKGGNANVGLWTWDDDLYRWLAATLTVDRLRRLLPEAGDLAVERYELPNLRALNFVVVGILGEGVASSTRFDPQAKGLGEFVRSRLVDLPDDLVPRARPVPG